MTTSLPDAEQLCAELSKQLKPHVNENTAVVGIHTGGSWLAERLHYDLKIKTPPGVLDISFYRDDFGRIGLHPQVKPSKIPFEVENREIILIDDVLYTGRTIRAAMNELFDYGRPANIMLAVLIDRGGRELPIAPRFVAANLSLAVGQNIQLGRDAKGKFSLSLHKT